jgi:hypothetical protein
MEMIMTKFLQFLTILNFVGLIVIGLFLFKSKEPSQSVVPAPTSSSSTAPKLTPMSSPPTFNPAATTLTASSPNSPELQRQQQAEIKGESGKRQTVDVLTGDAIDQNLYGDYEGKRVFFCHAGSKTRFEQDVTGNLQKVKEKGIVLETAPAR